MVRVATLILSLFAVSVAFAEERKFVNLTGGFGMFSIGPVFGFALDGLESYLSERAQVSFRSSSLAIGGWGAGLIKRIAIGGEGFGMNVPANSLGDVRVEVGSGGGGFVVGYLAFDREVGGGSFFAFPLVSVGFGGVSIRIRKGIPEETSFEAIVEEPSDNSVSISRGMWYISPSVFLMFDVEGVAIGVKAGWIFDFPLSGWEIDGIEVSGIPDFGIGGPFVFLNLGGGWFGQRD